MKGEFFAQGYLETLHTGISRGF